jgi:PIN domain nuclease of toxin-antitoxin system
VSRILLDTHLLLWAVSEPRKLPAEARRWIDEAEVFVSAASIREVSIKAAVGKLAAVRPNCSRKSSLPGFQLLPVSGHHAAAVALLAPLHNDPFDGMLVAQAQSPISRPGGRRPRRGKRWRLWRPCRDRGILSRPAAGPHLRTIHRNARPRSPTLLEARFPMNVARREIVCAVVVCISCLPARAADPPAANSAVVPPQPPAAQATPPVMVTPPRPLLRTVHRQVSRLPLTRDYRSVPVGDAATVAAHEKIEAALTRLVDADANFTETPLRDVVAQFGRILKVPVVLDTRALEVAGIDLDTPVTGTGQGTTARAALRRILDDLDLTRLIRDEALMITTKERAGDNPDLRLYPLPWGYSTQGGNDVRVLVDLIQNSVGGLDAWADGGGNGAIRIIGDGGAAVLVVSQTADVHDEIEGLLRSLHERDLAEFGGLHDIPAAKTPVLRLHHVADEAVRRDLATKLVDLCNSSLPHGTDPQAKVTVVGECLAVQALTPEFHALAGQLIRAVAGEHGHDLEWSVYPGGGAAAGVHGGMGNAADGGAAGGVF